MPSSAWLLFRLADRIAGNRLAFFAVTGALLLAAPHLLARPHIFTWFFGALTL